MGGERGRAVRLRWQRFERPSQREEEEEYEEEEDKNRFTFDFSR